MTAKAQTQTKQVEATTTNKRAAAKKPAAPKTTTSAAKKAVAKVSAGVKAKAAAQKKPTPTKKPSNPKAKVEAPATPQEEAIITKFGSQPKREVQIMVGNIQKNNPLGFDGYCQMNAYITQNDSFTEGSVQITDLSNQQLRDIIGCEERIEEQQDELSFAKEQDEANAKKSGNFSEIEEKHDAENVESLTAKVFPEKLREVEDEQEAKIAAMEAVQALASDCTKLEKLCEFLIMSDKLQVTLPCVQFCNDLLEILKGCVDQDGKLKIAVKPINPRGGKKTQSKVNGSSALRAFWAELIDRPEGATREELFEGGKKNFPDLSPKTMMSQLSQLRLGYDYGVSIHPEYSGRKAKEENGVYTWLPAEETKLEDYRIAKKEKTVGGIEMIGSDGRVWAGVQKVY